MREIREGRKQRSIPEVDEKEQDLQERGGDMFWV